MKSYITSDLEDEKLSLMNKRGRPRRDIKRVNASSKEFTLWSGVNSKCRARVVAHVNSKI